MLISVATANLYYLPFQQALDIIAAAGFEHIELDPYWERGPWAVAQHLKGVNVSAAVAMVRRSGLKVASLHDAGGVVDSPHSIQGFVNPQLDAYLDHLKDAPGCIVFHTPHMEGPDDPAWWQAMSAEAVKAAGRYRSRETAVTLENMPYLDGYYVPLATPQALLAFVSQAELGVTLDTTHYAQIGVDVAQAASVLQQKIRTVHLSDFADGHTHVFIGDGQLDFPRVFQALEPSTLHSVTLECSAGLLGEDARSLTHAETVQRLASALGRLRGWLDDCLRARAKPRPSAPLPEAPPCPLR